VLVLLLLLLPALIICVACSSLLPQQLIFDSGLHAPWMKLRSYRP
jgi:hypothetical protein